MRRAQRVNSCDWYFIICVCVHHSLSGPAAPPRRVIRQWPCTHVCTHSCARTPMTVIDKQFWQRSKSHKLCTAQKRDSPVGLFFCLFVSGKKKKHLKISDLFTASSSGTETLVAPQRGRYLGKAASSSRCRDNRNHCLSNRSQMQSDYGNGFRDDRYLFASSSGGVRGGFMVESQISLQRQSGPWRGSAGELAVNGG